MTDPIDLYGRAAAGAGEVLGAIGPAQRALPTPCSEWTVQDLVDHLTGGTEYLLAGLEGRPPEAVSGSDAAAFERGAARVAHALAEPGALGRTCMSPLGFEWPIGQAVMGTVMDLLVHTWDLGTAIDRPVRLDPDLVDFCIATFLPEMPERGRAAGIVGPAVEVAADAPAATRLLAAMGRRA
jgi:uncharacterized protein (TIGR03086 family)